MVADSLVRTKAHRGTDTHTTERAIRSVVSRFITGGMPDPDNPQPPGPWDPVIRQTLIRMRDRFGPHPEPWMHMNFGAGRGDLVSLNPQPLPPGELFAIMLAEEVVMHVSRLQDAADAGGRSDETASRYMMQFSDDIELCPPYRKWPFPRPPKRGDTLFDPVELATMGVALQYLAETIPNDRLRGDVAKAGARILEKSLAKM